jgi:hypothetical protein
MAVDPCSSCSSGVFLPKSPTIKYRRRALKPKQETTPRLTDPPTWPSTPDHVYSGPNDPST